MAADPIAAKWVEDIEAQGLPGQELLDLVKEELSKAKGS